MEHHHRAGSLKQQNKPFKSKHATKSSLKNASKGRTSRVSPKSSNVVAASRDSRRNTAKQAQQKKRQELIKSTRIFNGVHGAPRIVSVVPLCTDVHARDAVAAFAKSVNAEYDACPDVGVWRMQVERFKTSLQYILLPHRNLYAALDACKVSDYVVFVLSGTQEVDGWGELALRCLQAQGLPDVVTVLAASHNEQNIKQGNLKTRSAVIKSLLSFVKYFVPSQSRVYDVDHGGADGINAVRALCEGKPKDVHWRVGRSWMLGENVERDEDGTLKVTGIVRGAPLSANRLIHITNHGDYQVSAILSAPRKDGPRIANAMETEPSVLRVPSSDADSLISLNDPDTMENEQTWPTVEEMHGADAEQGDDEEEQVLPDAKLGTTPKAVKKVPKGTSQYQAAWIVEEDEEEESNIGSEGDAEAEEMQEIEVAAGDVEVVSDGKSSVAMEDLDAEEENMQFEEWKKRNRDAEMDLAFPDELDTPKDIPARQRFQRYRGLRSFRTSPWDPYENLPRDYARIFQFEDYRRTERAVRRRAEEGADTSVDAGTQVTVHLKDVPKDVIETLDRHFPFIVFSLLEHEHKVTVLNFTVQRNTEYTAPIKSKDPLLLCVGPRRLRTNPIFSQHTQGGGNKAGNNVHKFERFLLSGVTSIATVYGPVVFGNQPCMLLRETDDAQAPNLVAMGTFLNTDTTRIVAKRIILTGHPFKVHKKTATVRYMFFNPDDAEYFKPVQLYTKHGRKGHIRESLGTHGYFKAHFDGPLTQMDTVCMSLYKRVYPRWSTLWHRPAHDVDEAAMEE